MLYATQSCCSFAYADDSNLLLPGLRAKGQLEPNSISHLHSIPTLMVGQPGQFRGLDLAKHQHSPSRPVSQATDEVLRPCRAFLIFHTILGWRTPTSTKILGGLVKISPPPRSVSLSPKSLAHKKAVDTSQHSIGQPVCEANDSTILRSHLDGPLESCHSPPSMFGLVTSISLAGNGIDVACSLGTSS